jgi:hypothetical protein
MAVGADPAGELHLRDGSRLRADLVIAAEVHDPWFGTPSTSARATRR